MQFETYSQLRIAALEQFLETLLPKNAFSLLAAMRYAVLNGGKRMRPLLVYTTGEALGCLPESLHAPAAAVELIHCYSLIHDDLPAMDNDDLRRGKPTCHKVFGEATAILAGDALLTLAFKILSDFKLNPIPAEQRIQMIQVLSEKSGLNGMVGGQALDLASEGKHDVISLENLHEIHQKKTGALIEAAVILGSIGAGASSETTLKLTEYAHSIGLAFQIQDDILDVSGNTATLGKTSGKDQKQNKATFPSQLGINKSRQYANTLHQKALEAVSFLGEKNAHLTKISELFINRTK